MGRMGSQRQRFTVYCGGAGGGGAEGKGQHGVGLVIKQSVLPTIWTLEE